MKCYSRGWKYNPHYDLYCLCSHIPLIFQFSFFSQRIFTLMFCIVFTSNAEYEPNRRLRIQPRYVPNCDSWSTITLLLFTSCTILRPDVFTSPIVSVIHLLSLPPPVSLQLAEKETKWRLKREIRFLLSLGCINNEPAGCCVVLCVRACGVSNLRQMFVLFINLPLLSHPLFSRSLGKWRGQLGSSHPHPPLVKEAVKRSSSCS